MAYSGVSKSGLSPYSPLGRTPVVLILGIKKSKM